MTFFHPDNASAMLQMLSPVVQLDKKNKMNLETESYVVGPKADGDRAQLLFEPKTAFLYLITQSSSPLLLEGTYIGLEKDAFILDTEVVSTSSGKKVILAFDICAVQNSQMPFSRTSQMSFFQRQKQLERMIESISIPNLYLKPVAPSYEAETMWEIWQHLPFPIDGLVFTRIEGRYAEPSIKWKPQVHLTLDIALGEPTIQKDDQCIFNAYLYDGDVQLPDGEILSAEDLFLASGHKSFYTTENATSWYGSDKSCNAIFHVVPLHVPTGTDDPCDIPCDDIAHSHRADLKAIENERLAESTNLINYPNLHSSKNLCSSIQCPCDDEASILHCTECGALGVGTGTFTCLGLCSLTSPQRLKNIVWVPPTHMEWAKHSVVEVALVQESGVLGLQFKRLRRDKKRANSFHVANTILQEYIEFTQLCNIDFKRNPDNDTCLATIGSMVPYRKPYTRSNFHQLRKLHYSIKGWLYKTFGGQTVIDACSGALHDLPNWIKARFSSVLAIERDELQYQKGLATIQRHNESNISLPRVCLLKGDLSDSLDLSATDILHSDVDAIFCNFSIHYFLSSQEDSKSFFDNVLPHLAEGGRVIITFLQGEVLQQKGSFEIRSHDDLLEFEVNILDEETASVYIASIGVPHIEYIITRNALQERFQDAGLDMVLWLPFQRLQTMFPTNLSKEETEMSSMYAAAVFEKRKTELSNDVCSYGNELSDGFLFSSELPYFLEKEIIRYFSIPDLVKSRLLSNSWYREVARFQIGSEVKSTYFDCTWRSKSNIIFQKAIFQAEDTWEYQRTKPRESQEPVYLTVRAVVLYMQMGGPPPMEREDSYDEASSSSEDSYYTRNFGNFDLSDHSFGWLGNHYYQDRSPD